MELQNEPPGDQQAIDLQHQIDELKKSWPAHSVTAAMLQRLEELEEELEKALQKSEDERNAQADRDD